MRLCGRMEISMRLKLIDRIVLVLLLFVLLVLAIGVIAFGMLLIPEADVVQLINNVYVYWPNSAMLIGIGLVVVLLILRLLYASCTSGRKAKPASVAISRGDDGSVNVTMATLSDIIVRTVSSVSGVTACKDTIVPKENGMDILLKVTLAEDTPIPEKTSEIQTKLKESVLRLTGLAVEQVHVMVDQQVGKKHDAQ